MNKGGSMRENRRFIMVVTGCLLAAALLGCTTAKEMGRGFMGVSTKVLEEKRKDALKKSFALDFDGCYAKAKEILKGSEKEKESPIYAQDAQKKMIAVYLSGSDTTPVGIFFTREAENKTLIEVSSPSIYAKEEISKRIFTVLDKLLKPKPEELKTDVKEKSNN
jgi:hypothetical protein